MYQGIYTLLGRITPALEGVFGLGFVMETPFDQQELPQIQINVFLFLKTNAAQKVLRVRLLACGVLHDCLGLVKKLNVSKAPRLCKSSVAGKTML
jgi:hypothetical protein